MKPNDLKVWRKKHKLTQEKAAAFCKVKLNRWQKWEQGQNGIPEFLQFAFDTYELLFHPDPIKLINRLQKLLRTAS